MNVLGEADVRKEGGDVKGKVGGRVYDKAKRQGQKGGWRMEVWSEVGGQDQCEGGKGQQRTCLTDPFSPGYSLSPVTRASSAGSMMPMVVQCFSHEASVCAWRLNAAAARAWRTCLTKTGRSGWWIHVVTPWVTEGWDGNAMEARVETNKAVEGPIAP